MPNIGVKFRALHRPGKPFILANAWDKGSARMLAALGAEAIGTSSAAHAFTLGLVDGELITREQALAHARDLVIATPLPVSADLESGFGETPEAVAETIRLAGETGLAGCSIEDTELPGKGSYGFDEALARVVASVAAARALGRDFVLVARADGVMLGNYDLDEAIRRVVAFAKAGADCVYVPLPPDMAGVARICAAVDVPVNVLAVGPFAKLPKSAFAEAGVARISIGSALARATHRVIAEAGRDMFDKGDFSRLSGTGGFDIDALLRQGAR